jgi:CheY-like chemotaxis protein
LRILIAEDNPINQKIAIRLLEKRGHKPVAKSSGREALTAFEQGGFDLVLLDVQMPDMDGLEVTAAIREREKETGRYIPIIAMTAHTMKGDRERCLAAGMDAYVPKPIDPDHFFNVVESFSLDRLEPQPGEPAEISQDGGVDYDDVMARFAGDGEFLLSSLKMFRDSYPEQIVQIRTSFAGNEFAKAERVAHALKGSVANFGGSAAAHAAFRLETLARARNSRDSVSACDSLQLQIELLVGAVSDFARRLDTGKGSTSENTACR